MPTHPTALSTGLLALMLCGGCGADKAADESATDPDTGTIAPWTEMDAISLDNARTLLRPDIDDATHPTVLKLMPDRALGFVLDPDGDRVHVLDGRYGHDGRSYCIHPNEVFRSTPKGAAARCPDETTEVHRGALKPGDRPIALGLDESDRTAVLLTRGGRIHQAPADVLRTDPLEFLSLDAGTSTPLLPPIESGHVAAHDGKIAIAAQGLLLIIDGAETTEHALPGAALDLVLDQDGARVATDAGVWTDAGTMDMVGDQLVRWQESWWLVQVDLGQVQRLEDGQTIEVDDLSGPAATDPNTGVLHLATPTGLVRVTPDGSQEIVDTETPIDLDINQSSETVLLHADATLTVLVDETAYAASAPLDVFITTFSERPRSSADAVPCRTDDGEPSISSFMDLASLNRHMLDDLPAPTGLGLTPALVTQASDCDERDRLVQLIDHARTSSGILVHEDPVDCIGDRACHTEVIAEMLAAFSDDLAPEWASGMSTHHELELDWVKSMEEAGLPSRYLFFGMSMHPDIPHHTDLRAKDAWPRDLGDMGRAWSTDSAAAVAERSGTGWLTVYPGDDIPAFNLAGCQSLFLLECHPLLRGGGVVLDAEDVAILDLLLHRALTDTQDASVRAWSFHLPDIGTYDYTQGCTEDGRLWSGESCAAARLQAWLIDVDRRLVRSGRVRWTRPGDLAKP